VQDSVQILCTSLHFYFAINNINDFSIYICPDSAIGYSNQQLIFISPESPLYFFPYANSKIEWYAEIIGKYKIALPFVDESYPPLLKDAITTWVNMHVNIQEKPLPSHILLFQLGHKTPLTEPLTTANVLIKGRLANHRQLQTATCVEDLLAVGRTV